MLLGHSLTPLLQEEVAEVRYVTMLLGHRLIPLLHEEVVEVRFVTTDRGPRHLLLFSVHLKLSQPQHLIPDLKTRRTIQPNNLEGIKQLANHQSRYPAEVTRRMTASLTKMMILLMVMHHTMEAMAGVTDATEEVTGLTDVLFDN